jgi:hypothetical protein
MIGPCERLRIDDLRRAEGSVGLGARRRIRQQFAADAEAVSVASDHAIDPRAGVPPRFGLQPNVEDTTTGSLDHDGRVMVTGTPDTEVGSAAGLEFRPDRQPPLSSTHRPDLERADLMPVRVP